MAQFPLMGIRSVEFALPDVGAARDFYTATWGLEAISEREGVVWPASDLGRLRDALVAQGATLLHAPQATDEPGGGTILAVADPRGRTIRIVQHDTGAAPRAAHPDRPERLAHININSTDTDADTRFFGDALGFSLTDRSKMMAFVRTNSDHHSVVISDAPVNTLNHVAFQMSGWEGVMRAAGRVVDAGLPIGWGPGRHGPGNNVFTYFVDPMGFVIEYTADVLQVDDGYRVGGPDDWTWPPGRTDQWGIAPLKTPACKAAQLAIPFARQ